MSDNLEWMSRLADGDLEGTEREQAEQLAAEDPAADRERQWQQATRHLLATKCSSVPNDELLKECLSRVETLDRKERTTRTVTRFAPFLMGGLFIALLAAGSFNRNGADGMLDRSQAANLVSGFGTSGETRDLNDARADEAFAALRNSMGGGVRLQPTPALRAERMERGVTDGRQWARIQMRTRTNQPVHFLAVEKALGISDFDGKQAGCYTVGQINGQSMVTWCEGDLMMVLQADMPSDELISLADTMRGANQ